MAKELFKEAGNKAAAKTAGQVAKSVGLLGDTLQAIVLIGDVDRAPVDEKVGTAVRGVANIVISKLAERAVTGATVEFIGPAAPVAGFLAGLIASKAAEGAEWVADKVQEKGQAVINDFIERAVEGDMRRRAAQVGPDAPGILPWGESEGGGIVIEDWSRF